MTEQLLNDARIGHRGALSTLLHRQRGALRSTAVRMALEQLGRTVDPTNLVRQTLLQAQQAFDEFRGSSETEWFDWLQSLLEANIASMASAGTPAWSGSADQTAPFDMGARQENDSSSRNLERRSKWHRAIKGLPLLEQRVIRLRLDQEWTLVRMSMHLDMDEGQVAATLRTAVRRLRQLLETEQAE